MRRAEAEALIGTRVSAWTAANGTYVGTLVEILPFRPWRGRVHITGVLEAAECSDRIDRSRRGYRPGETITVGGVNIEPETRSGTSYREAVACDLREHEGRPWDRNDYVRQRIVENRKAELARLDAQANAVAGVRSPEPEARGAVSRKP